jgi:hypothetical protein
VRIRRFIDAVVPIGGSGSLPPAVAPSWGDVLAEEEAGFRGPGTLDVGAEARSDAVLRARRLDHQPFVYVWLDATYVHVREHRHVVSKAVVIATGLRADGHREVLGVDIGDSENETFWREFLTGPVDRGLAGVRLIISTLTPC